MGPSGWDRSESGNCRVLPDSSGMAMWGDRLDYRKSYRIPSPAHLVGC